MAEACPVCHETEVRKISAYRSGNPDLNTRAKVACGDCGLVFVSPMPDQKLWDDYNADYFHTAHGGGEAARQAVLFRHGIAKVRNAHVAQAARDLDQQINKVFEIGAGFGEFMQEALADQPDRVYSVVDTDASVLSGLVELGGLPFSSIDAVATGQDLVVASHVLEHTRDPVGFLSACASRLRDDGLVFVDVPCLDYIYKDSDEPHLMFFDKSSLDRALTQAGLTVRDIGYFGKTHSQIIGQTRKPRPIRALRRIASFAKTWDLPAMPVMERAALAGFAAHRRQPTPARWLRAIAQKC